MGEEDFFLPDLGDLDFLLDLEDFDFWGGEGRAGRMGRAVVAKDGRSKTMTEGRVVS